MAVRGIRGAITVEKNEKDAILFATEMLLEKIVSVNKIKVEDVASVVFSVTQDLNKEFPAPAARELGWLYTPLLCTVEIPVEGSLKKCLRILMHVNSDKKQSEMKHIYLGGAKVLRPDISEGEDSEYYLSE
jgi:chorismate mutase